MRAANVLIKNMQIPLSQEPHQGHQGEGFEADRPPVKLLWALLIVLTIVLAVVGIAGKQILWVTSTQELYKKDLSQIDPRLAEIRLKNDVSLLNYDVVDTAAQKFQIPVEKAMELLEQKGSFDVPALGVK